jgi:hypothetical protein
VNDDFDGDVCPEDIFAEKAACGCVCDCSLESKCSGSEFATYIDEGFLAFNRVCCKCNAFNELMRIAIDDLVVIECTWFGLVCVTAEVAGVDIFGQKAPFDPSGEPSAAAPGSARTAELLAAPVTRRDGGTGGRQRGGQDHGVSVAAALL